MSICCSPSGHLPMPVLGPELGLPWKHYATSHPHKNVYLLIVVLVYCYILLYIISWLPLVFLPSLQKLPVLLVFQWVPVCFPDLTHTCSSDSSCDLHATLLGIKVRFVFRTLVRNHALHRYSNGRGGVVVFFHLPSSVSIVGFLPLCVD